MSVALLVFVFSTVDSGKQNLILLSVLLLTVLSSSQRAGFTTPVVATATALFSLSAIATLSSQANYPGLRTLLLVAVVVALGVAFADVVESRSILGGLLAGSVGVLVSEQVSGSGDSRPTAWFAVGSPGPFEYWNILLVVVGVIAYLALFGANLKLFLIFSPVLAFLVFVAARLGLVGGFMSLGAVGCTGIVLLGLGRFPSSLASRVAVGSFFALILFGFSTMMSRSLTLMLAGLFFDTASLEERFSIWEAFASVLGPANAIIGYGALYFQSGGLGIPGFSAQVAGAGIAVPVQLHSLYLSVFAAFGFVGTAIIGWVVFRIVRNGLASWASLEPWNVRSGPWLFSVGLGILGVTESFLLDLPVGWFLLGILMGLYASGRPKKRELTLQ